MAFNVFLTGCTTIVTTTDDEGLPYADGSWHTLKAVRYGGNGSILLDNKWKGFIHCCVLLVNKLLICNLFNIFAKLALLINLN